MESELGTGPESENPVRTGWGGSATPDRLTIMMEEDRCNHDEEDCGTNWQ